MSASPLKPESVRMESRRRRSPRTDPGPETAWTTALTTEGRARSAPMPSREAAVAFCAGTPDFSRQKKPHGATDRGLGDGKKAALNGSGGFLRGHGIFCNYPQTPGSRQGGVGAGQRISGCLWPGCPDRSGFSEGAAMDGMDGMDGWHWGFAFRPGWDNAVEGK